VIPYDSEAEILISRMREVGLIMLAEDMAQVFLTANRKFSHPPESRTVVSITDRASPAAPSHDDQVGKDHSGERFSRRMRQA
jgi:hypothetical protein